MKFHPEVMKQSWWTQKKNQPQTTGGVELDTLVAKTTNIQLGQQGQPAPNSPVSPRGGQIVMGHRATPRDLNGNPPM